MTTDLFEEVEERTGTAFDLAKCSAILKLVINSEQETDESGDTKYGMSVAADMVFDSRWVISVIVRDVSRFKLPVLSGGFYEIGELLLRDRMEEEDVCLFDELHGLSVSGRSISFAGAWRYDGWL